MTIHYTKDHEYVRVEGDTGVVGITDYAQEKLGDVVYVELPEVGAKTEQGKQIAVVESVKAAAEVYAPVSGEVVEVNGTLPDAPGAVNEAPMGAGWFLKIKIANRKDLNGLMTEQQYKAYLESLG